MKKNKINLLFLVGIAVLLSSCAASYHQIMPGMLGFNPAIDNNGIGFSYKYNVQLERGNKRYSKKEFKKGMHLVAVKITNNTGETIKVSDDIAFYANGNPVTPLEPFVYKEAVKQLAGTYLLYLLLSPITLNSMDENGNVTSSFPIGLIIGPAIALGNVIGAASANANMLKELTADNIMGKTVEPGQTVTGLMALPGYDYPNLEARRNSFKYAEGPD